MADTSGVVLGDNQSCLEARGIRERHEEIVRNKYWRLENEYSVTHPDALSDGDPNGKGVGGNHTHTLPDCSKPVNYFDYSNFTTDRGGGLYDIKGRNGIGGREKAIASSLYKKGVNEYSAALVNTLENQNEGQYVIGRDYRI